MILAALADAWQRSPLRRRFAALAPRERLLVLAGLGLIGGLLAVRGVTALYDYRDSAVARQIAERADLQWMRANRSAAARSDAGAQAPSMSIVNAAARDVELALRRIDPDGEGFSVQIEAKPFEQVLRWSHALETRHGLRIVSATIDMHEPGLVNARFRVR